MEPTHIEEQKIEGRWKLYKATNLGKRNPYSHKFGTKCVTHGKMFYDQTTITHKVNILTERNDDKPPTHQGERDRSAF